MTGKDLRRLLDELKTPIELYWKGGKVEYVKAQFNGDMAPERFDKLCDEIKAGKQFGPMKLDLNRSTGNMVVYWERRIQEKKT